MKMKAGSTLVAGVPMPVLNGSAAGRVITRYKTYTSYNVLHLVISVFVTVNSCAGRTTSIYRLAVLQHLALIEGRCSRTLVRASYVAHFSPSSSSPLMRDSVVCSV